MAPPLKPAEFTDEMFGLPTVTDILAELEKPGRDPRPEFTTATFADAFTNTVFGFLRAYVLLAMFRTRSNIGSFDVADTLTYPGLLQRNAREYGDLPALTCGETTLTWRRPPGEQARSTGGPVLHCMR